MVRRLTPNGADAAQFLHRLRKIPREMLLHLTYADETAPSARSSFKLPLS